MQAWHYHIMDITPWAIVAFLVFLVLFNYWLSTDVEINPRKDCVDWFIINLIASLLMYTLIWVIMYMMAIMWSGVTSQEFKKEFNIVQTVKDFDTKKETDIWQVFLTESKKDNKFKWLGDLAVTDDKDKYSITTEIIKYVNSANENCIAVADNWHGLVYYACQGDK